VDEKGTGQIRGKSERKRDWNGASRAKAPEFGGQVKVSVEETNRNILNRENFDENKSHERPKKRPATAQWPTAEASDISGRLPLRHRTKGTGQIRRNTGQKGQVR
jgi:hypothetical protein